MRSGQSHMNLIGMLIKVTYSTRELVIEILKFIGFILFILLLYKIY